MAASSQERGRTCSMCSAVLIKRDEIWVCQRCDMIQLVPPAQKS